VTMAANSQSRANRIATQLLGLAALLNVAFGLTFAATLAHSANISATVSAPAEYGCGGDNLVDRLRQDSPDRLAIREAEAAAVVNGRSVFWRISGDGIADSWLFGTMHSPDPRVARLPAAVHDAIAGAETVMIENVDAMDAAKMAQAMVKLRHLTLLEDGSTLESLIGTESRDALRQAVEKRNMPWPVANMLQPWMVVATISVPVCDLVARQNGTPVLDQAIAELAVQSGKKLEGLETIEEQFAAVEGVDRRFHIDALEDTLALGGLADDLMETTKQLYLQGNTAMMLPIVREYAPSTYSGHGYADFRTRLISRRNAVMAERASQSVADTPTFIAVGALHLPGEDGLVSLLRKRGFRLEPVSF
jgi:uncharacterized protein